MNAQETSSAIRDWLVGRLPADWFTAMTVTVDREEITVVGTIGVPEGASGPDAEAGRITRFREETRSARIEIARDLEASTGRKVAWGVTCGGTTQVFTRMSVPVMTRLQQPQRRVLDTLVEAGVARSRSDALAWCVRLVAQHEADWLTELDQAMGALRAARAKGPTA
jgi:Arc/MetJ-type ribon-helix-helix transcriptional regulator